MKPHRANSEFFYFVKPGDTLGKIVQNVFHPSSAGALKTKVLEIQNLNPHLTNPDRIKPGQVVALGLSDKPAGFCSIHDGDFAQMVRVWERTPLAVREVVEKHWDILEFLEGDALSYAITTLEHSFRSAGKYFVDHASELAQHPPIRIEEIQRSVVQVTERTLLQVRADAVRIVSQYGISVSQHSIIRISIPWEGLTAWSKKLEQLVERAGQMKYGKMLMKSADRALTGIKISKNLIEKNWKGATKNVGEFLGGSGGASLGESSCVALAFATQGAALVVCAVVMPIVGSIGGGKAGGYLGEKGYDALFEEKKEKLPLHPLP